MLQQREDDLRSSKERDLKFKSYIETLVTQVALQLNSENDPNTIPSDCNGQGDVYEWGEVVHKLNTSVARFLTEKEAILSRLKHTESHLKNLEIENIESCDKAHEQVESFKSALEAKEAALTDCRDYLEVQKDSYKLALTNLEMQLQESNEDRERLKAEIIIRNDEISDLGQKLAEHKSMTDERCMCLEAEYQSKIHKLLSEKTCQDASSVRNENVTSVTPSTSPIDNSFSLSGLAQTIVNGYMTEALENFS